METYKITRYEEKSDSLFICINSTTTPVYLEHFFTEDERATEESRKATIEKLVAELEVRASEYVEPEQFVSKLEDIKDLKLSKTKIASTKAEFLAKRELELNPIKEEESEVKETLEEITNLE